MYMKLATKMRQLADSTNLDTIERDKKQYALILEEIELAAKDNRYYIYIENKIYSHNVERLELEGFKVTSSYSDNYEARISWYKK